MLEVVCRYLSLRSVATTTWPTKNENFNATLKQQAKHQTNTQEIGEKKIERGKNNLSFQIDCLNATV